MNRAIIIGGGVGPAAGLRLHRLILENTITSGRDQDHLKIIHMCLPDMIEDRTESLFNKQYHKVADAMAHVVKSATESCRQLDLAPIVGIPCNTFHTPAIWNKFVSLFETESQSIQFVNMIDQTLLHIKALMLPKASIGVLATSGTHEWKVYSQPLSAQGFNIIEPDDPKAIHEIIYNQSWGLKACVPVSSRAKQAMFSEIDKLKEREAERIIMGCTEIPLIYADEPLREDLVDPLALLARALINACCPEKLKPESMNI